MSLGELLVQDRRLVILRLLDGQNGFALNESVIHTALEQFGHRVTRDTVRADLIWLEEQQLVRTATVAERVLVAHLTERGADVATGRSRHPGVKRPSPGAG